MSTLKNKLRGVLLKLLSNILFLLLTPIPLLSQNQDKVWMMGYGCCHTNFTGINWDFRGGSLLITPVTRYFNFPTTNGQFCDSSGNPLFGSNGIYISNSIDDTMLNGGGLNPSAYTSAHSIYGLHLPQANLVVPMPGDNSKYYLFHETSDDYNNTFATYYLYYSIIDMTLDGGLGGVIQKNTILLHDSLVEGELTACKHANGRDWWLFAHKWECDTFYKFLVTPSGVQGPWIEETGSWRTNYFGQTVFSPDGGKFAYYEPNNDLDIWDFDRCTGIFSNLIHIDINDSMGAGGAAFSRSGRYLYVSSVNYVYQFDMQSSNIPGSQLTVAVYDSFATLNSPTQFYQMQLAPDDKIYINSPSTVTSFHVINNPDSAGLTCDLQQHSIQLPGFSASLPNHPNYFLGPVHGSVCDSLTSDVPTITSSIQSFNIFPNPARNTLYITQGRKEIIKSISVFNSIGQRQTINYSSIKNGEYMEVNVSSLSLGIYFLEILSDSQKIVKRFIKE